MRACLAFALAALIAAALLAAILVLGIRTRQADGAVPLADAAPPAVAAAASAIPATPPAWLAPRFLAAPGGSRRARGGAASPRQRRRPPRPSRIRLAPARTARGAQAVCRSGGAAPYSTAMGA